MRNRIMNGALVVLLAFGAGCGDDDDDGSSGGSGDICAKSCASMKAANCPNEDESTCKSDCEQMLAEQMCQSENRALVQCMANRPASDFECDSDGEATLKDGVCVTEGMALATCMLSGVGGAGGGGTGNSFTCDDGFTIPTDWVCDGEPDCEPGGEDEQGC